MSNPNYQPILLKDAFQLFIIVFLGMWWVINMGA